MKDILFDDCDLQDWLDSMKNKLTQEIDNLARDIFLSTSQQDLVQHYRNKYTIDVITLHHGMASQRSRECNIGKSRSSGTYFNLSSNKNSLDGYEFIIEIPFTGNIDIFKYKANRYTTDPPSGRVYQGETKNGLNVLEIKFYFSLTTDEKMIKMDIDRNIAKIEEHIQWSNDQISGYHSILDSCILKAIETKSRRLSKQ